MHAWEARQAFLRSIAAGEAAVDLAAAALHVAAEDDALVSHSTVQLPVAAYQQRLQRMAADLALQLEQLRGQQQAEGGQRSGGAVSPEGSSGGSGGGGSVSGSISGPSEAMLLAIQAYLWEQQRFRVPRYGRSNLPDRGGWAGGWVGCGGRLCPLPTCCHPALAASLVGAPPDLPTCQLPPPPANCRLPTAACPRQPLWTTPGPGSLPAMHI